MYKNTLKISILVIMLCFGFFFAKVYQPAGKTVRVYKNALKDFDNENYSNSYYLFSRVGYLSALKPMALYRQALCAKALGDKKTELKIYQKLFKYYPSSKLSMEARYQAGQLLIDENPAKAQKYFNKVSKSDIDEDYKIASEYYNARIESGRLKYSKSPFKGKKSAKIEQAFRDYLEHAPDGRLAVNVANTWKNFNPDLSTSDVLLVSKAYYFASMYKESSESLKDISLKDSWALKASNSYAQKNFEQTKTYVEEGILKYADSVSDEDYKRAVGDYLKIFKDDDKYTYTSKLFSLAKGKNKDYIWNLKCETSPVTEKSACFNSLYSNYPSGGYAQNAMYRIFKLELANKNYSEVKRLAHDYLNRFSNNDNAAEVMFWLGKTELKYSRRVDAMNCFQEIIKKYPDSYYAYRAFWILNNIGPAVIKASLEYKPVVYPYKMPSKGDFLYNLLSVDDYDLIAKFSKDEFIKSWVEYKKGNYSKSALIARDAMAKLEVKPVKNDLRWRLVYPQNYYIQVHGYARQFKNNDALIMSIIREESYFNSEAQSGVGAMGLMQLMPSTAHEIGQKNGIEFNTQYLLNPELNIKLGNIYFSILRGMLSDKVVHAVAAYNGGIGSVSKWKADLEYSNVDEFVEQIPYEETQNYVKKVFRSYWNYTRIYQE